MLFFMIDFSKKYITFNGGSKDLRFIDPATEKVVATVPFGEKLETARIRRERQNIC